MPCYVTSVVTKELLTYDQHIINICQKYAQHIACFASNSDGSCCDDQVVAKLFEGFNQLCTEGVDWKDPDDNVRFLKPFVACWLADGKERMTLTGFLKVSDEFISLQCANVSQTRCRQIH